MAYSPSGLQTKQALVPRRRHNSRNKKLDIELPNSNLSVVGVGSDTNGNKVIRFSYPNKRAFSIQIYNMSIRDFGDAWKKLFYGERFSSSDKHLLDRSVVYYIKNYGSSAQKKGLRTYGRPLKQNSRRRRNSNERNRWADSRQTDEEIAEAIFEYRKSPQSRHRVWEEPTDKEFKNIGRRAFQLADRNTKVLYWGMEEIRREDLDYPSKIKPKRRRR